MIECFEVTFPLLCVKFPGLSSCAPVVLFAACSATLMAWWPLGLHSWLKNTCRGTVQGLDRSALVVYHGTAVASPDGYGSRPTLATCTSGTEEFLLTEKKKTDATHAGPGVSAPYRVLSWKPSLAGRTYIPVFYSSTRNLTCFLLGNSIDTIYSR